MSTPNERVIAVETWSKLKPADFSRKTDIKPGTLSKAKKGPFAPSAGTMNKIITAFPQVSSDWLLQGKGEMLVPKLPADPAVMNVSSDLSERERTEYWKGVAEQALKELAKAEERERWYQELIGKKPEGNQHAAGSSDVTMYISHRESEAA